MLVFSGLFFVHSIQSSYLSDIFEIKAQSNIMHYYNYQTNHNSSVTLENIMGMPVSQACLNIIGVLMQKVQPLKGWPSRSCNLLRAPVALLTMHLALDGHSDFSISIFHPVISSNEQHEHTGIRMDITTYQSSNVLQVDAVGTRMLQFLISQN